MTIEEELNAMSEMVSEEAEVETEAKSEEEVKVEDKELPPQESEELQEVEEEAEEESEPETSETDDTEVPKPTPREMELYRQIEELKSKLQTKSSESQKKFEVEDMDFLESDSDEDLTEIDSKKLNSLLNKAYKAAAEKSFERVMTSIPGIIKTNLTQQSILINAANKFYSSNPDLAPYKQAVSNIAEEIISKNPNFNLEELFKEVEKESRKRLSLAKKAVGKGGKKPAVMSKPTVGKPGVKGVQHPLQQEIDAMNQLDI